LVGPQPSGSGAWPLALGSLRCHGTAYHRPMWAGWQTGRGHRGPLPKLGQQYCPTSHCQIL